VKSFGDLVRMSVGYSAAFGVSLQEIGQFSGEMMSELSMSVDQVESGYQSMMKGAEEAGIASNKFFGIIRGFSADLTLFTFRMIDATDMMAKLGKSMNPREAQKFVNTLSSMFKGESLLDRYKDVKMAGGKDKVNLIWDKSQEGALDDLSEQIKKETGETLNADQLRKALRQGPEAVAKWSAKLGRKNNKHVSADTQKVINNAALSQGKIAENTTGATASLIKDGTLQAKKDMAEAIVAQYLNGRKIEELRGDERVKAEEALKASDELQDQLRLLKMSLESTKQGLIETFTRYGDKSVAELEKGFEDPTTHELVKITKMEADMLKRNGLADKRGGDAALELQKLSTDTIANSMTAKQQQDAVDGKKTLTAEELMAGNTTSINTQLEILADFLMGAFYRTVMTIKDYISKLPWNPEKP
jgi:hypothetical protein